MLLLANVDDVSGELIPHAIDGLMARGACSVHVVQAITKKGRLEYLFLVDTRAELVEDTASYLALELGTLGVRVFDPEHIQFEYRFCRVRLTAEGDDGVQAVVRVKQLLNGEGDVISLKAELEDVRAALLTLQNAAPRLSLKGLKRLVEQVAQDETSARHDRVQAEYLGGSEDAKDPGTTR
jgi:pyridinium-3,5-bisthiocarboxylic acid mononucleotide nickel chelatase